ncbi:hypothetical protein HMPREF9093_00312 [Fusobacterium sp. oral taxon 370 str. F0437]|uniref:Panacea domain-containing protein n=1 Tax=Fusobacterium sp. oral taxon 370 TaxID=712288 RepID=UPI000234A8BA|nr:type II toxin-antitoxin system antitoxin SocA domain-containing protein [Fusobacterium sp. oral taxon 370]EHI79418.1 hypothetical protein HMPREF9093_00312 [Fusobacterium sp. oral taxon 370 str. F0437]
MSNLDKICSLIFYKDNNISNLVLQKLLYFIQAYSLVKYGKEAFTEEIEAWMYGPVVPEAYYNVKNNNNFYKNNDYQMLDEKTSGIVEEVVDVFGKINPFVLVDLTHSYSPWKNAWENIGWNAIIDTKDIAEYHRERGNENNGSIF